MSRQDRLAIQSRLITRLHPRSAAVEAYRVARTNLRYLSVDAPLKRVAVVSALPGEGKTLTVCNLGLALAQDGLSVVLVDGDLRQPDLHRMFNLSNRAGLTAVLSGQVDLESALQTVPTPAGQLQVLTSGPLPPNPAELLGSKRRRELEQELLNLGADMLLYDTPPVLAAADTAVLAASVDGCLMVVRAGTTDRRAVIRARDALQQVHARLLGVLLDGVRPGEERGYYSYAYSYHYGPYGQRSGSEGEGNR